MPAYTLPYTGVIEVPANTILGNNTGSAAAAIGMTQAQTLTFLGNPGGAFGADVDTQITPSTAVVLDHAINNEVGLSLSYTTSKAAGNDTGLLIAMTDTASPGTSLPLDVQVGGSSILSVTEAGTLQADLLTVVAPAATDVPISITGAAAQSANLQEWNLTGAALRAKVTSAGEFSNPGSSTGTNNEFFGEGAGGALTTGSTNTMVGRDAGANSTGASSDNVHVGFLAGRDCTGNQNTSIGTYAGYNSTTGSRNVLIGWNAVLSPLTLSNCTVIGRFALATAANQFVAGSSSSSRTNLYWGNGVTHATPVAYTVNGTGGSGTDIAGADINIAGGIGTGTGVGGDIVLQYAAAGSTGTAANTLAAALTVDGGTGNITVSGTVDGRDIAADGTTLDGLTSAAGLTTNNQTVTATDITGAVSQFYVCTITGLTANRNLTLPSGSAGDRIGVHIVDGDDTYALILKGAASQTINGGSAATEWSRVFIAGETVIFRCTAANTWVVESDGRIPCVGRMTLATALSTNSAATWTVVPFETSEADVGDVVDTSGNGIKCRRAGNYQASLGVDPNAAVSDQEYYGIGLYDGTVIPATYFTRQSHAGSALVGTFLSTLVVGVAGRTMQGRVYTNQANDGAIETGAASGLLYGTQFTMLEILG